MKHFHEAVSRKSDKFISHASTYKNTAPSSAFHLENQPEDHIILTKARTSLIIMFISIYNIK
jgi:hypothetical protein